MSLDPLHEQIARLAFSLPEADQVALAGGGAMLAYDLVERPTQDIDLFTPQADEPTRLADALAYALRGSGALVEVDRRGPEFSRLTVTVPDGRAVAVEIARDARIRQTVHLGFGHVLHLDEVAADKTLALFGRAAARDLVDVHALSRRYTLDQLCALAAEKDSGFNHPVLADALRAATAHSDAAFTELGLQGDAVASLRNWANNWREQLTTSGSESTANTREPRRSADPSPPDGRLPPSAKQDRNGPRRSL